MSSLLYRAFSSWLSTPTNPLKAMDAKAFVDAAIEKKQIVVFSKSFCPYCRRAKALIASKYSDVPTEIVELDERDDGVAMQDYLLEKTNQRTVPNIFINTQHIGGNDDLHEKYGQGNLEDLIRAIRENGTEGHSLEDTQSNAELERQ